MQANPARHVRRVPPPAKCEFVCLLKNQPSGLPTSFHQVHSWQGSPPQHNKQNFNTGGIQAPRVPSGKSGEILEIRRNLRVPEGREIKIAVAFFPD
ncbi:MAG: hypothetical protein ABSF60_09060 [Verrucomicrobiota bacterium]